MARRRLSPLPAAPAPDGAAAVSSVPLGAPIARVAAEAAASAALREMGAEMAAARSDGRLALRLPLATIETGWLVRDRIAPEGEEFAALLDSLRRHGQRTAIEVVELGPGRYGLISGWRRVTALARLQAETGEARFGMALALLRRPEGAAEAYLAMVEENEIRAGLSYYERARIVARATEAGVFPGERQALAGLFGTASPARRSKIGAFLGIVHALDGVLRFPAALPERLGLALARRLEGEAGFARQLQGRLARAAPTAPQAEQAVLAEALAEAAPAPGASSAAAMPRPGRPAGAQVGRELRPGLTLQAAAGRITLSGPAVTAGFLDRLEAWLRDERTGDQ